MQQFSDTKISKWQTKMLAGYILSKFQNDSRHKNVSTYSPGSDVYCYQLSSKM